MNGENCLPAGECKDCVVNISGNMVYVGLISPKPADIPEHIEQTCTVPGSISTDNFPIAFSGTINDCSKYFFNAEKLRIFFAENKANGLH